MLRSRLAWCSLALPLIYAIASCSSSGHATTAGTGAASSTSSTSSAGSGAGGDAGLNLTGSGVGGGAGDGGDAGPSYLIYACTDTTLFTLDPTSPSLTLATVGDFDCIGASGTPGQQSTAMTDLAVDRNQNIWGLSTYAVRQLTVQGTTVHCESETFFNVNDDAGVGIKFEALSFAPEGVITPGVEVLVAGDTAGELWSFQSGAVAQHGQFGTVPANDGQGHDYLYPGTQWELSGDIVFLANSGSPVGFATVRDCPNPPDNTGCNPVDTLVEIDMTALGQVGSQSVLKAIRGQVVKGAGCGDSASGYGAMYGIASWNNTVFGFSTGGNLVAISNVDGTGCLAKNYPGDVFSGAAVTTIAPVIPPPAQ